MKSLETSQLGGQVILTVKCADGLALLTKEETVTQGMINPLALELDI